MSKVNKCGFVQRRVENAEGYPEPTLEAFVLDREVGQDSLIDV